MEQCFGQASLPLSAWALGVLTQPFENVALMYRLCVSDDEKDISC